jgi:Tfp pilus assembly protein PilF
MFHRLSLIALSVPAALCLGGCQLLQKEEPALKLAPAEQVRHGASRPEAQFAVGRYYQGQVRYDKAIDAYRALLADYPEHAEAQNALGVIFATQGRVDAAIEALEKAVANAPESASIRNNLGYAFMLKGSTGDAIATLQTAARLDPGNARVRDNLAIALARAAPASPAARLNAPATRGAVPAERMQLVAVATNVFSLQQPARVLGQSAAHTGETMRDSPLPAALGEPEATGTQAPVSVPAATGKSARLEVSNGNGISGLARKTSAHLEAAGYANSRMTNELPYRLPATEIQYRPGFEPQARDLQTTLRAGIPLIASQRLRPDVQVRLLLGKDVKSVAELVVQVLPMEATPQQVAVPKNAKDS